MGAGSGFGSLGGGDSGSPSTPVPYLPPVISYTNTPPGAPVTGDRYLIGTSPTGAWVGKANQIAEWNGASWSYTVPVSGDFVYVTDTLLTYMFNGVTWAVSNGTALLQNGNTFGSPLIIGTNDNFDIIFKRNNASFLTLGVAGGAAMIGTSETTLTFSASSRQYLFSGSGGPAVVGGIGGSGVYLYGYIAGPSNILLKTDGNIDMPNIQVGATTPIAIPSGGLYVDTVANALASTDYIVLRKV